MGDKLPRLTAKEAENLLFDNGFEFERQKGSHKIYKKGSQRMVLPHHSGKILHQKLSKNYLKFYNES